MKFLPGFDPEGELVTIKIESNLLKKYFYNLRGMLIKNPNVPDGIDLKKGDSAGSAILTFPLNGHGKVDKEKERLAIESTPIIAIKDVINEFVQAAIKREMRTVEFIPLSGYPLESLQTDMHAAAKAKRSLCIIKDYSEFLAMEKKGECNFNQFMIEHGQPEWADVILDITSGQEGFDKIIKEYTPKLEYTEWC